MGATRKKINVVLKQTQRTANKSLHAYDGNVLRLDSKQEGLMKGNHCSALERLFGTVDVYKFHKTPSFPFLLATLKVQQYNHSCVRLLHMAVGLITVKYQRSKVLFWIKRLIFQFTTSIVDGMIFELYPTFV